MHRVAPGTPERDLTEARAEALFQGHRLDVFLGTDRLFAALLGFQWLAAVAVACLISPRAWAGGASRIHVHLWAATLLGGAIISLPVALALLRPGKASTRHAVAVAQALMGGLLIHLSGGRIETHFHIFGSLALLAFYRDWPVLLTTSVVVAVDHAIRGVFWPASVYGVLAVDPWRWIEHSGWLLFEDIFLIRACTLWVREMRTTAARRAQLEVTQEGIERTVRERTAELREANRSLAEENAERVRAEESLRRLAAIVESSADAIIGQDCSGTVTSWNAGAERLYGYAVDEAIGRPITFLAPPGLEGEVRRILDRIRAGEQVDQLETRRCARDGRTIDVSLTVSPVRDAAGRIVGASAIARDITGRKLAEDKLAHQATHDGLTGLPNRTLLIRRIGLAISSPRRSDARFALMLLDLDRFKEINDSFGHHCGDEVLKQLNPRLLGAVRQTDLVARLGGDEFGILLSEADEEEALRVADRILADLGPPIAVEGRTLDIGGSIGIAIYPDHGTDATSLFQRADAAMYAAKRGRIGRAVYQPDLTACTPRRLALIGELRRGIEGGQLLLHYQPKIDLATMRVGGVEALVRWLHPRDGLISPDQFMPLAEETGLIRPLGLWVLEAAILQCRAWHDSGLDPNVAVNLSPENLHDDRLTGTIRSLLEASQGPPRWLTVEVTETAMMQRPDRARKVLEELHEMGVRISIDDFGTGYSSLAYLKELPVDEVKVDRSFVKDMMTSRRDSCIVQSVIDLGHNLGLEVAAEGVEDRASLEQLASWGCDSAQGYYFSRPLPPTDFATWLAAGRPPRRKAAAGICRVGPILA